MEEEPAHTSTDTPDLQQIAVYVDSHPQHTADPDSVLSGDSAPPVPPPGDTETQEDGHSQIPDDHLQYIHQLEQQNESLKNTVNQLETQNATG